MEVMKGGEWRMNKGVEERKRERERGERARAREIERERKKEKRASGGEEGRGGRWGECEREVGRV